MTIPLAQSYIECDSCGRNEVYTHTLPRPLPKGWGCAMVDVKGKMKYADLCATCYENAKAFKGRASKSNGQKGASAPSAVS